MNRACSLFCKVVELVLWSLVSGSWFGFPSRNCPSDCSACANRFKTESPRVCTRMSSASRWIATRPLGSLLTSAGAIYRRISLRRQRRSRSTRQARSHRTSRLSSRSFQGVKLQNKGVIVYTSGLKCIQNARILFKCKAELQAAFAFGSCCQGDRVHCYQGECGSEGVLLLPFTLGTQGTLH